MIVKIKNKTASPVNLNMVEPFIVLSASTSEFCFYNKPLLSDQNKIRELVKADIVEFLDENGNSVVHADVNDPSGAVGIGLVSEMFNDLIFKNTTVEEKNLLKTKICQKIKYLIKSMWRDEGIANYTLNNLITALNSQNVLGLLEFDGIVQSGNAINSITTEPSGFFTVARKNKLKNILDSVSL